MEDDIKFKMLFVSYKNICSMVEYRGYDISNVKQFETFEEFAEYYHDHTEHEIKDDMEFLVEKDEKKLLVLWHKDPKLDTSFTNLYSEKIEKPGIRNVIIVVDVSVTPYTKGIIKSLSKGKLHTSKESLSKKKEKVRIDDFTLKETQRDIAKHVMNTKHVVCTNEEKKQIMKGYGASKDHIPRMGYNSAMARYMGLFRGTLVKSIGKSSIIKGKEVILGYRIVW